MVILEKYMIIPWVVFIPLNGKQLLKHGKDLKGWGGTCYKQGKYSFQWINALLQTVDI